MARSKLRKSNSALSRGQMVRIENRFTLRLEEDTYDPDAIGTCCTANADGEKCVCADNVTARACCEQKGDFKEGESCSNDPCPCNITGACCVPCDTDADVLGQCISGVTSGRCAAEGGFFQPGVECGENTCEPCNDNTVYEAKVACCEECPNGTNTGRNGQCVTKTATGFSITEALQNARDLCAGTLGQESTGKEGTAEDPCASGNGGCPDCSLKTRPFCTFCTAVFNTNCESTRSGECVEVEVDNQGNIIINDSGLDGVVFNPGGVGTDIFCADLDNQDSPYYEQNCGNFGNAIDCTNCQNTCCCQNGEVTSIPINGGEVCDGETILLESGQACDPSEVDCLLDNFCIECAYSTCDCNDITVVQQASDPGAQGCKIEVDPKFVCQVVNTNKGCPGFERPSDSDVLGEVSCDVFGAGSDPSANGGCGCGNCDEAAILECVNSDFSNLCGPIICSTCDRCRIDATYTGGAAGCGGFGCCRADGSCDAPTPGVP
jgi:hypothetical protein